MRMSKLWMRLCGVVVLGLWLALSGCDTAEVTSYDDGYGPPPLGQPWVGRYGTDGAQRVCSPSNIPGDSICYNLTLDLRFDENWECSVFRLTEGSQYWTSALGDACVYNAVYNRHSETTALYVEVQTMVQEGEIGQEPYSYWTTWYLALFSDDWDRRLYWQYDPSVGSWIDKLR